MLSLSSSKCIAALAMLLQLSNALHFYVKTGETKCFYEELPENTLVVGKIDAYEKQDHSNEYFKNPNLKVQITVEETFDNNHKVANQKSAPDGDFAFTSLDSGEHRFCLTPVYSDKTNNKVHRIFFDVAQGSANEYVDSKSTRMVDDLAVKVNQLYDKLDKIHWEQEHMREREAIFRDQSESTNSRVVKWSIVQLVVLVGTCVYQLRHLKSFFVKQKIV
ncbi:ensosomal (Golgi, ER,...) cargo receptor, putative [Candida dubliniensis CD36]|uniref:Ensosomal (Golgi, ER,...) cargo receptor, putative n=1 Tax=Candida dubliniensis (strain CD36 / ATCC MYA-646 / CBS 7987 / NCPF 3949 / NRRL Y-17841) TaxID=573826 RepID=B9W997_CANDC|nr:ensosomal (Golgi, ER,...) cargo receptor, putative [Candida dubliniensis CD36]CAX45375.1 ensosomal (Golgi, ER,...) cargo receptor, putative [Candida dubliniensis CD36]